jgi:serine/threonine-protein kinase
MPSGDTVAGTPPLDQHSHADGSGSQPDPADPTISIPNPSTPGPHRADHSTGSVTTDEVRVPLPPGADPEPGLPSIPGYRMLSTLGRGGMGTVYRARQLEMDREVALKLISPGGRDEAAARSRFTREVRALARIEHPNIVPIYDAGDWQGFPYYTMKLVPRGPLSRHLVRFTDDLRAAVRLVAKVGRAVGALHAVGVMHRDLKPLNILLGDNDEPLVADFGLARWISDDMPLTDSGSPVGTRQYMSPEQSLGSKTDYTPACDIWALGIILFEVLTGRRPFASDDPVELYLQIRGEPAPPAASFNPAVPPELDAVIGRCLRKRPEDRYPTADAVAADLESWLAGEAFAPPPPERVPSVRSRRRGWIALAAGLVVVCGVGLGVAFWPKPEVSPNEPPARELTIAEQLAAGETVELIGPTDKPLVEWRAVHGYEDTVSTVRGGCCTLTSTQFGAIELVSEALPRKVRLETEVVLVTNDMKLAEAGVYVGRKETPFAGTIHHTAVFFFHQESFTFLGNGPVADPVEVTSTATAELRWFDPHPGLGGRFNSKLGDSLTASFRVPRMEPRWHTWRIDITPDMLTATWDGEPFQSVTAPGAGDRLAQQVTTRARRIPANALPTFTPPVFGPGIGLYVRHGDGVFRNTRLIPVK